MSDHLLPYLIDSHCHLDSFLDKGQLEPLLSEARSAQVGHLITIGTQVSDWETYRQLAAAHPEIDFTVGLHPCHVDEGWHDDLPPLSTFFATDPAPVALGEIGLDHFHLPKYPDEAAELKQMQERAFRSQLELAYQLDCPVVIHSRNAFAATVKLIDDSGIDWSKVVFHCFSEGPEAMQQLLERGAYASFTGIITYPKSDAIRAAARLQGLDRLMLETDAPYLAPQAVRGQRNQPAYLAHTAAFCAELFDVPLNTLVRQTQETTHRFFLRG